MSDTASRAFTISLPVQLVRRIEEAVAGGRFSSESDLVARAVEREFRRSWNEPNANELEALARHPEFLRDLDECMESFAASDAEAARLIPDEI